MPDESPKQELAKRPVPLKMTKEVRDSLDILFSWEQTYLIATAIHVNAELNVIKRIYCEKGIPIGGFVYDSLSNSYTIECVDYVPLGYVPASFVARLKNKVDWEVRVPMSDDVIKKYLTSFQKKELRLFKSRFKASEYTLQFVQMIDPN